MHRGLYFLPVVFFIAMTGFLFFYDTRSIPAPSVEIITKQAYDEIPDETTEEKSLPALQPYPELEGFQMDANTATMEEWQKLPGIGEQKARDITEYIAAHGPLEKIEDLLQVKGIGEKTLEKIRPYLEPIPK